MATWWGKFTFLSMHNTCQLACKKTLPCFYQLLYFFQWCCSWQLLWTNRCPSSYVTWLDELLICESKRWGKGWERSVGLSGQSCPPDLEAEACFQLFQFDRNASLQCVCFLDWPTAVTRLWIRGGGLRLRCSLSFEFFRAAVRLVQKVFYLTTSEFFSIWNRSESFS